MPKYGEIDASYLIKLLCVSSDLLHWLITSFRVWDMTKTRNGLENGLTNGLADTSF